MRNGEGSSRKDTPLSSYLQQNRADKTDTPRRVSVAPDRLPFEDSLALGRRSVMEFEPDIQRNPADSSAEKLENVPRRQRTDLLQVSFGLDRLPVERSESHRTQADVSHPGHKNIEDEDRRLEKLLSRLNLMQGQIQFHDQTPPSDDFRSFHPDT